MPVSPELADVLATIIRRVRDRRTGAIPLLSAYDYEERLWNPPSPLLFQWDRGGERSRMSGEFIRSALGEVLAFIGLTDSTGQPLVGTCAHAYGTACVHEHACVRCSLLRPDPSQRGRLVEIRNNLIDRRRGAKGGLARRD